MTEHDLSENNRILASISSGGGASGVLATVVNLSGPVKSQQHSAMSSDDIQGALITQQPQPQPQPQPQVLHRSHHAIPVQTQGSQQPLTTAARGNGVTVSGTVGSMTHGHEGAAANNSGGVQVPSGAFNLSLGHLQGAPTPTSQLLQHQHQQHQ
ncbi:hypothetical protein BGZ98_001953, partial [Dissophora globulifera]